MLEDLGNLGDFLGGIGVVATMIYLAVQIRRNTQAIQATSSMHEFLHNWRTMAQSSLENPEILKLHSRGMADFDSLSNPEKNMWFMYMIGFVFQAQIGEVLYKKGQSK